MSNGKQKLYERAKYELYNRLLEMFNQERFNEQTREIYRKFCRAFKLDDKERLTDQEYLLMADTGIFDIPLFQDLTLVDLLPREQHFGLNQIELEVLNAFSHLFLNVYSVKRIENGSTMIKGLLTDDHYLIDDEHSFGKFQGERVLIARIARIGSRLQTVGAYLYLPGAFQGTIMKIVHKLWQEYQLQNQLEPLLGDFFRSAVFEIIAIPQLIRSLIQEDEGEELYQSYFKFKNRHFIRGILLESPRVICQEKGQKQDFLLWVDREPGQTDGVDNDREEVLGSLVLTDQYLILNTTDRNHLQLGKELIKELAGIAVSHYQDFIKSQ